MKRLVELSEVDGLEKLMGEMVQLWCVNYIYAGRLIGVNERDVVLEDGVIVFETGELGAGSFKLSDKLPAKEWFVRTAAVESYGLAPQLKK